jgi:hypothetical protein
MVTRQLENVAYSVPSDGFEAKPKIPQSGHDDDGELTSAMSVAAPVERSTLKIPRTSSAVYPYANSSPSLLNANPRQP